MPPVDEYLRYAEQCLALAAQSSSAADKARLLQMAQAWRDLAEKRGNGERETPPERG
jgi:NAD-dependent oxidoreductase involved in siderophore biosynthesis